MRKANILLNVNAEISSGVHLTHESAFIFAGIPTEDPVDRCYLENSGRRWQLVNPGFKRGCVVGYCIQLSRLRTWRITSG